MDAGPIDVVSLIRRKRAKREHSAAEIAALVEGALAGTLPDYQLAAWLMAVCYEHLSYAETLALTQAFVDSGTTLRWPPGAPVVDKHSTGGVGDKVSLILLPWLAACGLRVPKMSGRGLGHTGGTVDKLESIPGFRSTLSADEMQRVLAAVGCFDVAQSAELAPADKLFYSLRDATDTVEEMGLIAASVMSKKLAAGAQHIVLDVKCGRGAFFADLAHAREFANLAIRIGEHFGRRVACVISGMQQPLGRCVGNALEVQEALNFVRGNAMAPDLHELCLALGAEALLLCGQAASPDEARAQMERVRENGSLAQRFAAWIVAQGGDLAAFSQRLAEDTEHQQISVTAPAAGYIESLDALAIGELARDLSAGRRRADDVIDLLVGVECTKKVGERVAAGETLALIHARREADAAAIATQYQQAVRISDEPVSPPPVVLEIIGA